MNQSKIGNAIKHPVWISVATVVGVLTLAVSAFAYLRGNGESGEGLSIAAVSIGEPTDLAADQWQPTGYVEDVRPMPDVAAAPIDITFKNNGKSLASITEVTATFIKSDSIQPCGAGRGAGGVSIAAQYSLQIPLYKESGEVDPIQVSTDMEFAVKPGETERLVVTVGPERQADNAVVVFAVSLGFVLDDGSTLQSDPVVLGTTQEIIKTFVAQASESEINDEVRKLCEPELAKIDAVIDVGEVVAEPVQQLRDAYQRLS